MLRWYELLNMIFLYDFILVLLLYMNINMSYVVLLICLYILSYVCTQTFPKWFSMLPKKWSLLCTYLQVLCAYVSIHSTSCCTNPYSLCFYKYVTSAYWGASGPFARRLWLSPKLLVSSQTSRMVPLVLS